MLVGRTPSESMVRVPNFEQAGYVNQTGLSRKVWLLQISIFAVNSDAVRPSAFMNSLSTLCTEHI